MYTVLITRAGRQIEYTADIIKIDKNRITLLDDRNIVIAFGQMEKITKVEVQECNKH